MVWWPGKGQGKAGFPGEGSKLEKMGGGMKEPIMLGEP